MDGRFSDYGPGAATPKAWVLGLHQLSDPPLAVQAAKNSCFARFLTGNLFQAQGGGLQGLLVDRAIPMSSCSRPQHLGTSGAQPAPPQGLLLKEGQASPRRANAGGWAPLCFHHKSNTSGENLTHCPVQGAGRLLCVPPTASPRAATADSVLPTSFQRYLMPTQAHTCTAFLHV